MPVYYKDRRGLVIEILSQSQSMIKFRFVHAETKRCADKEEYTYDWPSFRRRFKERVS